MTTEFSRVVYRPTPSTAGAPFGLRSVGHARFGPSRSEPTRVVTFVHLLWTECGTGYLEQDGRKHRLRAGEAFCYRPGMRHRLFTREDAWEYRWLTLDGPCATGLVLGLGIPDAPFDAGPGWADSFRAQGKALHRVGPREQVETTSGVYAFLVALAGRVTSPAERTDEKADAVARAKALMAEHLNDPSIGVRQIAAAVGLERTLFSRVFRQVTGTTPKGYLDDLRLQAVLTRLRSSSETVEATARWAGFGSANYLAKFLRRKIGLSPSAFRSSL